ncbi:MAG TPA: cytochrome C, partial [Oceanithermus profundus]|nr:cytochrome C [Oceanithermus profundus]
MPRWMKLGLWMGLLLGLGGLAMAKQSDSACVQCHTDVTPGVVHQFHEGRMGTNAYL